ncbi:MAG: 50S ribosomal protein L35ae [Promethearchaeota archaeon]
MSTEINTVLGNEGYIVAYRQSKKIIHPRFSILQFPGIETREDAGRLLLNHTVAWTSPSGKFIKGKITRVHGRNGAVCAHFKNGGLPGQAFGTRIKIVR